MVMKMLINFFRPTYLNVLNVLIEMQMSLDPNVKTFECESINQQAFKTSLRTLIWKCQCFINGLFRCERDGEKTGGFGVEYLS